MKKIFTLFGVAVVLLAFVVSCAKSVPEFVEENEGNGSNGAEGNIELTITGYLGEYLSEGTKSSLVNNVRVAWANGDKVLVFEKSSKKYLGYLTAAIVGGETREAKLSGTIATGSGTLVFVHGTGIDPGSYTAGDSYPYVNVSLASQGSATPFVVYGTTDYSSTSISNLVVHFNFATSVIGAYITGISASKPISEIDISGINTICSINILDATVSGNTSGTISLTSVGSSNAKGQAYVEFAVPISGSTARTALVKTNDNRVYWCAFSNVSLAAGKSYETLLETQPAYAPKITNGLTHYFSVSPSKVVRFSKGNLRATYDGTAYSWGFAEKQYDFVGGSYSSTYDPERITGNNKISSQASGDVVDLFGWVGSSSTVLVSDAGKYGISVNGYSKMADYGTSDIDVLLADWGTTIDKNGTWRTMSYQEWKYLLETRESAAQKVGYATVDGKYGIILLPDYFVDPMKQGGAGNGPFVNKTTTEWDANIYSASNWEYMEQAGAVFLPVAGYRVEKDVDGLRALGGYNGFYWTSTLYDGERPYFLYIVHNSITVHHIDNVRRYWGNSVRLVTEAN